MYGQFSDDMETFCYTLNEGLGYGVPILATPLSILKELPITDNEKIILKWDCSNVDDVARQVFEKEVKPFTYTPPHDDWTKFFVEGGNKKTKSSRQKEDIYIRTEYNDMILNRRVREKEILRVTHKRAKYLVEERGLADYTE